MLDISKMGFLIWLNNEINFSLESPISIKYHKGYSSLKTNLLNPPPSNTKKAIFIQSQ